MYILYCRNHIEMGMIFNNQNPNIIVFLYFMYNTWVGKFSRRKNDIYNLNNLPFKLPHEEITDHSSSEAILKKSFQVETSTVVDAKHQ